MKINHLVIIVFSCAIFATTGSAFARADTDGGNGSSGVGNRFPVDNNIDALTPPSLKLLQQGDVLIDEATGEKLMELKRVPKSKFRAPGTGFVKSTFGNVSGYEYLPDQKSLQREQNYWVICPARESCLQLKPLSRTNPAVMKIIGGLRKK